jgi:hypothetical protein
MRGCVENFAKVPNEIKTNFVDKLLFEKKSSKDFYLNLFLTELLMTDD